MPKPAPSLSGLPLALITLLARRPATGYDLAAQLKSTVGNFWTARHGQIYPALSSLAADGLVDAEEIDGAGPRPTKRYSVTKRGLAALRATLDESPPPAPVRDTELMQVYSLWLLPPDEARHALLRQREHHEAEVRRLTAQEAAEPWRDNPADRCARATLRWGIAAHTARVAWCNEVLDTI